METSIDTHKHKYIVYPKDSQWLSTLIYCERVITAFGRRINENMSPNGRQAIPTPPNIWIE